MSTMISLGGIILASLFLVILSYRGYSILLISVLMTGLVAVMSGESLPQVLLGPYMAGFISFAKDNYLIFLFSALFGKLMTDSGAAATIACSIAKLAKQNKNHSVFFAVLAIPAITAVLTYGGVSLFVVVFTLVAIARSLFKELDIPWQLFPVYTLGSGTFTMSMLPGSPAIQNLIPMKYLGTTPMAAPLIGIISALITMVLGTLYVKWSVDTALRRGEHFLPSGTAISQAALANPLEKTGGQLGKSLLPLTVPFIVMNIFHQNAVIALVSAVLVCYLLFRKEFPNIKSTLNSGASDAVLPIINVCATVGFGKAFASVAGFGLITDSLAKIPGPPELQLLVAVGVISAITGSAAGGLGLSMEVLSERFLALNIDREVAHRIASMSSSMGALPHNGSIISGLTIARLTHRQSYRHYFFLNIVFPLSANLLAVMLAQFGLK